jgi:hypothetical protein
MTQCRFFQQTFAEADNNHNTSIIASRSGSHRCSVLQRCRQLMLRIWMIVSIARARSEMLCEIGLSVVVNWSFGIKRRHRRVGKQTTMA